MTVAGKPTVNYTYDANSCITSVVGAGLVPAQIAYDAIGRRTSLALPNAVTTNYSYYNASRLLNLEHLNPLNQILEKISYGYDANGNRKSMNRLNVLVKLPNPVSNITYNAANQMLTYNDKNITYDENGNMTSATNGCGTTNYTWDARNRLVGINGFDALCAMLSASFKYDAIGRRIEKTVNGKTTSYLYDGWDIVQEIEDGQVTVNYIRTLNIDEPLTRIKSDGTVRYYQTDALGSVIALTDENGAIRTQYNYDPFGNTTITGETSDNPFQYAGRENDGTGLLFERNRYYSFELQRYISEDPIRLAGGDVNFYVRVGNSPVNEIDPYGLFDYNAPYPTTWPLPENTAAKVTCLEKCLGIPLTITGGAEPTHSGGSKGPHGRGEAADVSFKRNPKLPGMKKKFMCCAKKCGFSFAQEESTPPHYHIQTGTGEGRSTGELPTSCGDC